MKLEAKDSSGDIVVKECNDEAQIKNMLKRGWKEASAPKKPAKKFKGNKK